MALFQTTRIEIENASIKGSHSLTAGGKVRAKQLIKHCNYVNEESLQTAIKIKTTKNLGKDE